MKKVLLGVVVLVLAVLVLLYFNLGVLAKSRIERVGSRVAGVRF